MQYLTEKMSRYIIIMVCFFLITGCSDSGYIKKAKCLPPAFPTTDPLNPHEERYRQIDVDKPAQEILDYYLELLTPVEAGSREAYINGTWSIEQDWIPATLLECPNSIDAYTGETGCIILHTISEEKTTIEYIWNLGEVIPGCSPQFGQ